MADKNTEQAKQKTTEQNESKGIVSIHGQEAPGVSRET
jgi:hypothetical protein